jgi:hypothetical protein
MADEKDEQNGQTAARIKLSDLPKPTQELTAEEQQQVKGGRLGADILNVQPDKADSSSEEIR